MYIGEVSKLTGVSIKAIRFYEEKGLLPTPQRLGRYRVYRSADVSILLLIKEAKSLGMTLSQLKAAARFHEGELDWNHVVEVMLTLRQQLVAQITDLQLKVQRLDECYTQLSPPQIPQRPRTAST